MGWFTTQFATFFAAPFLFLGAWLGFNGGTAQMPFIPAPTSTTPIACTQEAKECPDGSYVGRVGPDCDFEACPAPKPAGGVSISAISPVSGEVGSSVTLKGSGFTSDNTVTFGYGSIVHVASAYGTTLTFTVPDALNPRCYYSTPRCLIASKQTTSGVYAVSVQNSNGTSNSMTFTVTSPEPPQGSIRIDSFSPKSGPVGTTVSITGFGFTGDNTVFFGSGAIVHVPISSQIAVACTTDPNCIPGIRQTIQFTVPESIGPYCPPGLMIACPMYMQLVTPGTYNVRVENGNGTSKTVQFTVIGEKPPPSSGPVSISGIDAPAQLSLGQTGTWTVHATISGNTQLHYSVNWGDEVLYPLAETNASASVQTSATFTHVYNQAGTYTPAFTVSNDSGESATVSATVTVTPLY